MDDMPTCIHLCFNVSSSWLEPKELEKNVLPPFSHVGVIVDIKSDCCYKLFGLRVMVSIEWAASKRLLRSVVLREDSSANAVAYLTR